MGRNWDDRTKISADFLEYGVQGHYRVAQRVALVATQAANSRLFELRNSSAHVLVIPTRIGVRWIQTAAHTAAIEDSLDLYRATGFTAVDTADVATPTASVKRTSGMTAQGSMVAQVRHVTATGVAAGMTGGTLTADTNPLAQLPAWLLAAQPTGSTVFPMEADLLQSGMGEHPLVLAQNEGFVIRNRVLLGAAAGSSVYFDISWAEVPTFD